MKVPLNFSGMGERGGVWGVCGLFRTFYELELFEFGESCAP